MMNFAHKLTIEEKDTRTYKTQQNAIHAIEKEVDQIHKSYFGDQFLRYLIVTVGERFTPIVIPTDKQFRVGIALARKGFRVIG